MKVCLWALPFILSIPIVKSKFSIVAQIILKKLFEKRASSYSPVKSKYNNCPDL